MKHITPFANRLKEYRVKEGLTLIELESITGTPAQTLNRYELGQRVPKIDTAIDLAEKMKIHPLWLQGFDVPFSRWEKQPPQTAPHPTKNESLILGAFHKLNDLGQIKAIENTQDLTAIPRYRKDAITVRIVARDEGVQELTMTPEEYEKWKNAPILEDDWL